VTYYTRIRFDAITVRHILLEATCTNRYFLYPVILSRPETTYYFVLVCFQGLSEQFGKTLAGLPTANPTLIDRTDTYV